MPLAHEPLKWYDDEADHPRLIKALTDVRRQATLEGYCYHHVQAIIVAIAARRQRTILMPSLRGAR
jgi:hypothetical protein